MHRSHIIYDIALYNDAVYDLVYDIVYNIVYHIVFILTYVIARPCSSIFRLPSALPSDAKVNPSWNSDDERDFQDQQCSPPSPMPHYYGLSYGGFTGVLQHI
jgi:hypothetical protein